MQNTEIQLIISHLLFFLSSLPDHFCPPDGLLKLHQPLFVLIPLHQHTGHLHPGEPPPLRHCHVAILHGWWKLGERMVMFFIFNVTEHVFFHVNLTTKNNHLQFYSHHHLLHPWSPETHREPLLLTCSPEAKNSVTQTLFLFVAHEFLERKGGDATRPESLRDL